MFNSRVMFWGCQIKEDRTCGRSGNVCEDRGKAVQTFNLKALHLQIVRVDRSIMLMW